MSIRQRIIFLFFSTFVAIAIIGGFSVRQSSRNASEVKLVTYGVVPSAMASAELIGQLKDVQMAVMQMVEAPDMEFAKQSREKLIESKGRLEDALKLQHKMADSQAQRGLVEQAQESMANYYASIEDTTKFKLAGQMDLAQANLADQLLQALAGGPSSRRHSEWSRRIDAARRSFLRSNRQSLGALPWGRCSKR